jgi:carbon monoxide dehydrogenase subunit G
MKLKNEFTVAAPLDRAWETLLDIERVANFLPGATIEASDGSGVYQGAMRIKLGPMVVNYKGSARLGDVDEKSHTAAMEIQAKELKGQGGATAVIHNRLVQENGHTRVIAETDLQVTGRQAQFGRGIMQDVAGKMLNEFARRFESYLLADQAQPDEAAQREAAPTPGAGAETPREDDGGAPAAPSPTTAPRPVTRPSPAPPRDAAGPLGIRMRPDWALAAGAAALVAVGVGVALRSRGRGVELRIGWSW